MTSPTAAHESQSSLFQLLEAVSATDATRAAIIRGDLTLTFGTLVHRARELSGEFGEVGIAPGDRVAVILPNGPEFLVAAFAIWKHGAILVPLHVRFQEEEILKYVIDCGVRTIITHRRMSSVVRSIQDRHTGVEHAWMCTSDHGPWSYQGGHGPPPHKQGKEPTPPGVTSAWPALTQYSTGSTGFSKRVTRSHQQLIGEFNAVADVLKITGNDRILGVAPFFHNYGLMNAVICGTLSGATVYALEDFFPRDVARLVESEKVTGFLGVPFMHQLLADLHGTADFSSLRYVLSAGAPLLESTASAFRATYGISIRQLYGTTETGVISLEAPDVGKTTELSVGVALSGVSVRVVDDSNLGVRIGVEGQVAVTSRYAAVAYDNLVGRSDSYFEDGTFFPGDLGRLDTDGRLVLSGRRRQFINVAGNKVDPAEVESVLLCIAAVTEAVVVGVPDDAAGERVKAVLVTSSLCSRKEVLDYCSARLADFKRPRIVEFRKEIPKSPLGKILRKYLIEEYDGSESHPT